MSSFSVSPVSTWQLGKYQRLQVSTSHLCMLNIGPKLASGLFVMSQISSKQLMNGEEKPILDWKGNFDQLIKEIINDNDIYIIFSTV